MTRIAKTRACTPRRLPGLPLEASILVAAINTGLQRAPHESHSALEHADCNSKVLASACPTPSSTLPQVWVSLGAGSYRRHGSVSQYLRGLLALLQDQGYLMFQGHSLYGDGGGSRGRGKVGLAIRCDLRLRGGGGGGASRAAASRSLRGRRGVPLCARKRGFWSWRFKR